MCSKQDESQTIQMVKKKFGLDTDSDNFEILDDYYKLSLICPLTKKKLELPARGTNCQHLECFDLRSYLSLTHDSILTNCPICKSYFVKSTLRIDTFILNILSNENSKSLSEVNVDKHGNWFKVGEVSKNKKQTLNETILLDSDMANETIVISDDEDGKIKNDIAKIVQRSVKKEKAIKKPIVEELSKKIIAAIEKDINQIKELIIANVIISGNNNSVVVKNETVKPKRVPRKKIIKPEPIIPEESIKHRLRARKSLTSYKK